MQDTGEAHVQILMGAEEEVVQLGGRAAWRSCSLEVV